MIIEVDTAGPVPPYEQIRQQVTVLIETGVLVPGTRLPPVRQLAADLGLAVGTVARSYRELEAAGLVTARVRTGTVVADRPRLTPAQSRSLLVTAADEYAALARRLGIGPQEAHDIAGTALSADGS
ncbi:DNA-binding transcriptional regulator YhcF (GntR family) [Allocatelliglobosispora scoriae]|uniref:DNA-binding transcriptional regulator YhcF (GntR family) n=1 Tax=Allocatelliglobosispora scoriae TaxID=643052 RepID=A0A841C5K3_9ACTN|nr:GntR family transcriptional regulator [Allocatelliglobosispora scoriae]MBB5874352.1 DNA-binding transcriptional regulator YhcF (GntR family) [Allocatelliglobosispora scoriae]